MTKGNICNDTDLEKCKAEHDGSDLEWACDNCPKIRPDQIHPYTRKLLEVKRLVDAGFPLDPDMLTYEEWLDLGKVKQCLMPPPSILR